MIKAKSLLTALALAALIGTGCAVSNTVSEEELGLRKGDLYSESDVAPDKTNYIKAAPGSSKKFDRSFENAPPLIPHDTEGMLPITRANNACLGCHMPAVAKSMGATPVSPTHFKDFFAATKKHVAKFGGSDKIHSDSANIAPQRFNCSQCHVPQVNLKPLVENTFSPDFRDADGKNKSNLLDNLNEGVK